MLRETVSRTHRIPIRQIPEKAKINTLEANGLGNILILGASAFAQECRWGEVDLEEKISPPEGVNRKFTIRPDRDLPAFIEEFYDSGTILEFRAVPIPLGILFGAKEEQRSKRKNYIALKYNGGVYALVEKPLPETALGEECDDWLALLQFYAADPDLNRQ